MVQLIHNGILLTKLKRIPNENGDLYHALKKSEEGYTGFGEAYFSIVKFGSFKGWKKHSRMVLNIIVPVGSIRFYIIDERKDLFVKSIVISPENYCRLTVPPGVWLGFEGVGAELNMLLNIASIEHDPAEAENKGKEVFAHLFSQLKP